MNCLTVFPGIAGTLSEAFPSVDVRKFLERVRRCVVRIAVQGIAGRVLSWLRLGSWILHARTRTTAGVMFATGITFSFMVRLLAYALVVVNQKRPVSLVKNQSISDCGPSFIAASAQSNQPSFQSTVAFW